MNAKYRPKWFILIREFIKKIFRHTLNLIPFKKVKFFWQNSFEKYLKTRNINECKKNLLDGMDEISKDYVEFFISMMPFWNKYRLEKWAESDKKLKKQYKKFLKTFKQPYPEILHINPYIFFSIYGLFHLPDKILENINDGDIIIDAGGMNGDTAVMLHKYFPKPYIHVFEPLSVNIEVINKIINADNDINNKIIPIKKGLGKAAAKIEISFNDTELAEIASIDETYENCNQKISLIKSDTEGFETSIIDGAKNIIKRDKPVLAMAIYHTPFDFFELKDKLKKLNPEYNFMIRRSENIIPLADFVLIAY